MKEKEAMKLLRGMADIGDDLIEEAGAAQKRKKMPARWRWAAIAACLCLALAGTAAAARYFGVQIVDGAGGDEDPDVWLKGGISYYPVDSLPEAVMELDDPFYSGKCFDSWDEIEDFIGIDLMNNPVLDASPAKRYSCGILLRDGAQKIQGRYLVIGSGSLTQILIIGCYEIGEVNITVQGHLFTDRMAEIREDWDERFMGIDFSDKAQVSWEDYTTPGGLEAHLVTVDGTRFAADYCEAVFSLNGIPFLIKVHADQDIDTAKEALIQILDGFQV